MESIIRFLEASSAAHFLYAFAIALGLSIVVFLGTRRLVPRLGYGLIAKIQPQWVPAFEQCQTFKHFAYLLPVLFLYGAISLLASYAQTPLLRDVQQGLGRIVVCWGIVHAMLFANALSESVLAIYQQHPVARVRPIKGFVQIAMLLIYILGGGSMLMVLFNRDPSALLTTVGGGSIVLGLIFRETILSFTAGIQIATNQLVQQGDWIEVPKYGANGRVIEIALHIIKVQNADKSIVVFPTYKLLDEGFKNWRSMKQAQARRALRAVSLDQNTIRQIDAKGRDALFVHPLFQGVFESLASDMTPAQTNLGLFMHYAERYIAQNPRVRQDMACVATLMEATPTGVPLRFSFFVRDTESEAFERVQSAIFEHLIAVAPLFGLRIFQTPSGFEGTAALEVIARI